ncbi:MAG: ABC transporter substrate-binding protein [Ruminococcus sp.]|nr:ABC transporter substrate-binding protein [Ruminococcus sp.]
MRRLRKAAAAAGIAAVMTFCSCGGSTINYDHASNIRISFSWWGKDVRHKYTTEAIEIFEEQNEGIYVTPRYAEWAGFKERMDAKIGSGSEADVMQINFNWLYEYTNEGNEFYDLGELSDIINLNSFDSKVLEYGMIDGKLLAIPISMNAQTVYINKTLFDKYSLPVPKTWEEYFKAAEVMSKDGVYVLRLSKSSAWHFCIAYAEQAVGKRLLNQKGDIGFDDKDFEVLFDFYKQMIDKGVTKLIDDRDRKDFENGNAAGTVMWISDAAYYVAPCRDNGNEIAVADYPIRENAAVYGWYAKPTSLYAISANTENPQEAAKLVEFLLSSQEMTMLRGLENGVPASKSALEVLEANDMIDGIQLEADEMRKKYALNVDLLSPYTETSEFIENFDELIRQICSGDTDIPAAAKQMRASMIEILEKNK